MGKEKALEQGEGSVPYTALLTGKGGTGIMITSFPNQLVPV